MRRQMTVQEMRVMGDSSRNEGSHDTSFVELANEGTKFMELCLIYGTIHSVETHIVQVVPASIRPSRG